MKRPMSAPARTTKMIGPTFDLPPMTGVAAGNHGALRRERDEVRSAEEVPGSQEAFEERRDEGGACAGVRNSHRKREPPEATRPRVTRARSVSGSRPRIVSPAPWKEPRPRRFGPDRKSVV